MSQPPPPVPQPPYGGPGPYANPPYPYPPYGAVPQPINYAAPGIAPPPKRGRSLFGWVLFIGLAVILFITLSQTRRNGTAIPLSEFNAQLERGNMSVVVVDGDTVRGDFIQSVVIAGAPGGVTAFRTELPTGTVASWGFVQWLLEHARGAEVRVENSGSLITNLVVPLIPWILIFLFIWFFVFRNLRRQSAASSQPPKPMPVYLVNPESPQ